MAKGDVVVGRTVKESLPGRFLTPVDLAELLGVPVETVYKWPAKRVGPPGVSWVATLADRAS
jgi:hypothetical protein